MPGFGSVTINGPTSAEIIAATAREAASIKEGLGRTLNKHFAHMRDRLLLTDVPGAVVDIWDVVVSDFKSALTNGKFNCRAVVFDKPYAEGERDLTLPRAQRAAACLVEAGFNAEAIADTDENPALGTNFYRIVVSIGLR